MDDHKSDYVFVRGDLSFKVLVRDPVRETAIIQVPWEHIYPDDPYLGPASRDTDPITSVKAGERTDRTLEPGTIMHTMLKGFHASAVPMNCFIATQFMGLTTHVSEETGRRRCSDLKRLHLITPARDDKGKVIMTRGRTDALRINYEITPKGVEVLKELNHGHSYLIRIKPEDS